MIIKYDFLDYQLKNALKNEIIILNTKLYNLKSRNDWYNHLSDIDELDTKIKNKQTLVDNEIDSNLSVADKIALLEEDDARIFCEKLIKYQASLKDETAEEVEYTFYDKTSLVFDVVPIVKSLCENCIHCSTAGDYHICKCKINKERYNQILIDAVTECSHCSD